MFEPGELTAVELALQLPTWRSDEEPGVWLQTTACGETFEYRVAKAGFWLDDAADLAGELAGELQDWICETSFGWGQIRSGPPDDALPGPPVPPGIRAISVHVNDDGALPLWESGTPADPTTLTLSPALITDLNAWQNHTEALADAIQAAYQPPRPTTEAGLWVQYVNERSVLAREVEATQRRQQTVAEWHAWVNELQPTRETLVRRLREELGPTFAIRTPPRMPDLT